MEGVVLLVLFIVFAPITLAIIALVKVSQAKREIHQLRSQVQPLLSRQKIESVETLRPTTSPGVPKPLAGKPAESKPVDPKPAAVPVHPPLPKPPSPVKKSNTGIEFMMGGKAAAYAGVVILVMGIVFLVGYAIQHSWIGPGTRVVLGLLCGGVLVGVGHFVQRKDEKLLLFARVLTGGGGALFYFSVFAAYGIYHLIGPVAAGFGLFVSALAVFGLAMAYCSQAVGVLGVLGAFITPMLIGGDVEAGIFPLVYVAVINVPVLLLGVRRKWQVLYNLAFVFTIIHFLIWLGWVAENELWAGLGFAVLFFAEYAALGLLKLRSEQQVTGRTVDMVRLISASLLLLGAVYWLLDDAGKNDWVGSAFLLLALLHVALARFAFKVLSRFNEEILAFLAGGLFFAVLALPAQLDGEWVSLGWALEGAALAWFAVRVNSRILQAAAFLLGLIGIMKALLFDVTLYNYAPHLFLNARFAVGMLSAGLLGVQGWLAGRCPDDETKTQWQDGLWWAGVLGAVLVFFADTFWTLGSDDVFSWLITSLMLLTTGAAVMLLAPAKSSVVKLGWVLLLLVPVKLLIDGLVGFELGPHRLDPFFNVVIWIQLAMAGAVILLIQPRVSTRSAERVLLAPSMARSQHIMALAAGIGVLTLEIWRSGSDWADTGVTILWAVCALALILFGMRRHNTSLRYFGLILFGLTTLKVLLVDSSELQGLERIAAFMGTGILLLALSFAYQKASAYFESLGEEK